MRIVKYLHKETKQISYGVLEDDLVIPIKGNIFGDWEFSSSSYKLEDVVLLPPVLPTTKIVCVGLNYYQHAKELNMQVPEEPIIFLKPVSAVIGPSQNILYPLWIGRLDYEAELAVVISKKVKNITPDEAKNVILGYTCFNDVTARDLQKKDGQWTRAKSFDTFAPIGPWIETEIENPMNLEIKAILNDNVVQHSNTNDMIFDVFSLVSFISKVMTLFPGDVIATGTPPGVGPMKVGDKIVIEIEKIGRLENYVVEAE